MKQDQPRPRYSSSALPRPGARSIIILVAAAACLVFLLTPPPAGIPMITWRGLAAILLPVVLWATGAVPEYLPSLLLFFLALVFGVAPREVVFSGFLSQATWLVFGGIVIGQAVQKTGLARRLVDGATRRFTGRYGVLIAGLAVVGFAISFFIPSAMGRAVLLTPIALAIAERFGYGDASAGRIGIVLAMILGSTLPAFAVLPANVPNLVMTGAAEQIYAVQFRYSEYALLNLPVLGVSAIVVSCILIPWFFSGRGRNAPAAERGAEAAPGSHRALAAILLCTVGLWITDSIHGISPAWIALGAALACLLPGLSILKADEFIKSVNLGPWLFVAGIIALGAVAADIGLADLAARHLEAMMPSGDFGKFLAIVFLGIGASVLTNHPAAPALVTPLAGPLAEISGWPLTGVLYAQVPGWIVFPFVYQVPPIVVALSLANIEMARVVRFFLAYFAISAVTMLPLHYLWGRFLGYFP